MRPGDVVEIEISGIGTLRNAVVAEVWGPTTEAESMRTIHRALELGVNFFDMAPGYGSGKAEEVLGRALHGIHMKR